MINLIAKVPALVRRSPVESLLVAVLLVVVSYVIVPLTAGAKGQELAQDRAAVLMVAAMQNETVPFGRLPESAMTGPYYVKVVTATAYNSLVAQTDSTPFITASGTPTRHGVIAANFLPIGTQVTIPDYYGDQIFTVEDRMNPRYTDRIDIWMAEQAEARQFGKRSITIYVYTGR